MVLIALLAFVATTTRPEESPAKEYKGLAADLALLQGSWELIHGKDGKGTPSTRSVKTIEGNKETLRRYNLQTGQLRVEHTSEFTLTKSGSIRVFTFYKVGDTTKNGLSYVYCVDKENFYDIPGLLHGDEYQNYQTQPGFWHWQRLPDNDFNGAASKARENELTAQKAWKKIASWRIPMPKVKVLNGNELMIDDVRCRLFGVKLLPDATRAARAKQFLEHYVKDYGEYYSIYNDDRPVSASDGVPLIWLKGSGDGGWAQETLVQAGLVGIDYAGFESYHFKTPGKDEDKDVNWKDCLEQAELTFRSGGKPNVNFVWPEK